MPEDSAKERSGKQVSLQGSDEKAQLALYIKATQLQALGHMHHCAVEGLLGQKSQGGTL
jgi:hypothetical protein